MPRFVPRERKHRRLAKQKDHAAEHITSVVDSNALEISASNDVPDEKQAKRRQLQAQLRPQDAKISSKKRKRLDKYIDSKLKREENLELLKKLEAQKVDTGLLQSSKKLGRRQESKRERLQRALDEKNAGIDVDGTGHAVLYGARPQHVESESEDDDAGENAGDNAVDDAVGTTSPAVSAKLAFGSGLKRPLETDESGQPILQRRKRRKKGKAISQASARNDPETDTDVDSDDYSDDEKASEHDWQGFSSDDSVGASDGEQATDVNGDDVHADLEDDDDELSTGSDEESEPATSESDEEDSPDEDKPQRMSAFKAWAHSQHNAAIGFTPSSLPSDNANIKASFKPRAPSPDPLLNIIQSARAPVHSERPTSAVTVPRSEEVQSARLELPVVQEEQKIMEAINNNPVVVVCGATGSGKTTQVPQMLFENGYGSQDSSKELGASVSGLSRGMIGVTQPRRVAATSVAARVSYEMGEYGPQVAHQVRYDTNVSRDTAIKFMTDGILLREIQQDFILAKYSAVVVDEAHERSVNTDILIGMLSRIVDLRSELSREDPKNHYPLKLVIMSATLRVQDFLNNEKLFRKGPPPVVEAEGRQFPVTVHFSRKTNRDYVEETVSKVARGHRKLPPGGMLVFLTGQQEIQTVAKRLRERLGGTTFFGASDLKTTSDGSMPLDVDDFEDAPRSSGKGSDFMEDQDASSDDGSEAEFKGVDAIDDGDEEFAIDDDGPKQKGPLRPHILPLFAALPPAQQLRVFQPAPPGSRAIILATNVAETSLTIPGIKYVFDSGRSKEKRYDPATGVQTFEVDWISKASAAQRTGRAGRTGPGHCWRLYSSAIYEQFFAEHGVPEILRTPLESTVLQLKAMEIENVVNFPYPTPPDRSQLAQAERLLMNLGAIEEESRSITTVGREVLRFPVSPRFGKMLVLASKNNILELAISLVAGLAVGDLFIPEAQKRADESDDDFPGQNSDSDDDDRAAKQAEAASKLATDKRHQAYTRAQAALSRWDDHSDAVKLLTAVAAHAEAARNPSITSKFCADLFLREKGMGEVQQLRQQLHAIVRASSDKFPALLKPTIALPTDKERAMLNQIVVGGFIDQVAIRADLLKDDGIAFGRKPRRATEVPYRTLFPSSETLDRSASPQDQEMQRSVFVHPSSVLARLSVGEMPQYIVYSHLSRGAAPTVEGTVKRTRMHPLATVGPKALAALAENTALLEMGKPVGKIEDLARDGRGVQRRQCWVGMSLKAPGDVGGVAWPLGAWKVIQRRGRKDWVVEKVVGR